VAGANWLTTDQIVELDKSGLVEIGSHTVWHPYLKRVAKERQWQELNDSKKFLDKLLNKSINVICYPFGMYNQQIEDLAKQAGYEAGLTFDQDAWQPTDNLLELKRISVYPSLDVIKFLEKLKMVNKKSQLGFGRSKLKYLKNKNKKCIWAKIENKIGGLGMIIPCLANII